MSNSKKKVYDVTEGKEVVVVKQRHVTVLEVEHRQMFKDTCECFYDLLNDDYTVDNIRNFAEVTDAFSAPAKMRAQFRDGSTVMLVPNLMEKIEALNDKLELFILVITKNEHIWTAIAGDDINY